MLSSMQTPSPQWQEDESSNQWVSSADKQLLEKLDRSPLAIKNAQGDFEISWFRELMVSVHHLDNFQDLERLIPAIQIGAIDCVNSGLQIGISRKLRFHSEGDTLLHLAVKSGEIDMVKLFLQDIAPTEIKELLYLTNAQGKTPIALAHDNPEKISIITYLEETAKKVESQQSSINSPITNNPSLIVPLETIDKLREQVSLLTDENHFQLFNPNLITLCKLTILVCQQAIEVFDKNQCLLHDFDWIKLKEKISRVSYYYRTLLKNEEVLQKIKLSIEYDDPSIASYEGIIYINPLKNYNVELLIEILLHEADHLVHLSYDIQYASYEEITNDVLVIDFYQCTQLATEGCLIIPKEKIQLLILEGLLKNNNNSFNLANHLAHRNADTFAVFTLALAAVYSGSATIFDTELTINSQKFLKNLSAFSENSNFSPANSRSISWALESLKQLFPPNTLPSFKDNDSNQAKREDNCSDTSTVSSPSLLSLPQQMVATSANIGEDSQTPTPRQRINPFSWRPFGLESKGRKGRKGRGLY